jgi:tetratricopeptide (TPR) repeat protein
MSGGLLAIGFNQATDLLEPWMKRLTRRRSTGSQLYRPLAKVLGKAFQTVIQDIHTKWLSHDRYQYLVRKKSDQASASIAMLVQLETESLELFYTADASILESVISAYYPVQPGQKANLGKQLKTLIRNYAYGYDTELMKLLYEQLIYQLPSTFTELVQLPEEPSPSAWKEIQRLQHIRAEAKLDQIENRTRTLPGDITDAIRQMLEPILVDRSAIAPFRYRKALEEGVKAYQRGDYDEAEAAFQKCRQFAIDHELFREEFIPLEALASINIMKGKYLDAYTLYTQIVSKTAPYLSPEYLAKPSDLGIRDFAIHHLKFATRSAHEIYGAYLNETIIFGEAEEINNMFILLSQTMEDQEVDEYMVRNCRDAEFVAQHLKMRTLLLRQREMVTVSVPQLAPRTDAGDSVLRSLGLTDEADIQFAQTINLGIWQWFNFESYERPPSANHRERLYKLVEVYLVYIEQVNDENVKANYLFNYGEELSRDQRYNEARLRLHQALAVSRTNNNHKFIGLSLWELGHIESMQGQDTNKACLLLEQALDALRAIRPKRSPIPGFIDEIRTELRQLRKAHKSRRSK